MLSVTFNLTHFRSFFISTTKGGIDKEHWPEMG